MFAKGDVELDCHELVCVWVFEFSCWADILGIKSKKLITSSKGICTTFWSNLFLLNKFVGTKFWVSWIIYEMRIFLLLILITLKKLEGVSCYLC